MTLRPRLRMIPRAGSRFPLFFVLLLVSCVFVFSIEVRRGYLSQPGGVADGSWKELNGLSAIFAHNWLKVPPWQSNFPLNFSPARVDGYNNPYLSYPPGYLVPLYLYLKIGNQESNTAKASYVGLAFQWITALMVALLIFFSCSKLVSVFELIILSCSAGTLMLLMSPALLWGELWWPDTAGLPVVAFFLLFEFFAEGKQSRLLAAARFTLIFAGVFTDWFVFVFFLLYIFLRLPKQDRELQKQILISYLLPLLLALVVFFVWLQEHNGFPRFYSKSLVRLSMDVSSQVLKKDFSLLAGLRSQFGLLGFWLMGLSIFFSAILFTKKKHLPFSPLIGVFTLSLSLAVALHWILLRQHYREHPYPYVRFAFVFSLVLFGWGAAAILHRLREAPARMLATGVFSVFFSFLIYQGLDVFKTYKLGAVFLSEQDRKVCRFVRANLASDEVLFSKRYWFLSDSKLRPESGISKTSLAECMAWIYYASSLEDIRKWMWKRNLALSHQREAMKVMFLDSEPSADPLVRGKSPSRRGDGFVLYEIPFDEIFY